MAKKKGNRYKVWEKQAYYDLQAAHVSFDKGFYEWSCYQSNQAVEKILKSVIAFEGMNPPRSHKLGGLLGMVNHANKQFKQVQFDFRKIEAFTYTSRYPFIIPSKDQAPHEIITKQDAADCLHLADGVLKKVAAFMETSHNIPSDANKEYVQERYSKEDIQKRISQIVDTIVNEASSLQVHKMIVYGSYAREEQPKKMSTLDLLVVADTKMRFIDRLHYVREITKGSEPIVEPVVYTPEEMTYLLEEEGEGYLENAINEGRVVWEKGD